VETKSTGIRLPFFQLWHPPGWSHGSYRHLGMGATALSANSGLVSAVAIGSKVGRSEAGRQADRQTDRQTDVAASDLSDAAPGLEARKTARRHSLSRIYLCRLNRRR
jgi:hypothetical protein